jgi:hypothetical protein
MAIKGKKKPQQRGGRARRTPAAAPRPVPGGRRRDPWYQTTRGRLIAGALAAAACIGILAVVANARSNSAELATRREAIEDYAGEVRGVLQRVSPAATEMAGIVSRDDAEALETIREDAASWRTAFEESHVDMNQIVPAGGVDTAHGLFLESLLLYRSAARTYELAPDVGGESVTPLLERAADQRSRAEAVWGSAIGIVDAELAEVGGDPSGLRPPSTAQAPAAPLGDTGAGEGDGGGGNGGG